MTNIINIEIWGRTFTINVEYDCYVGEKITQKQIEAFEIFCNNLNWIEKAKKEIEKYCKSDVEMDNENTQKDNVFSYIKPEAIFIKRDDDKKTRVALMCKYRYDPEHGLAVVFDLNGKITVGMQNIIL